MKSFAAHPQFRHEIICRSVVSQTNARSRFRFLVIYIHIESHARDNSPSKLACDPMSLEQAFLTTANHNNCPKIHAMTKRYPKDPILFSHVEINRVYSCHRITAIYFLCRAILSLKRRCPAEVMHRRQHRHLMTIICFAVYFPWFLCQLSVHSEKFSFYM